MGEKESALDSIFHNHAYRADFGLVTNPPFSSVVGLHCVSVNNIVHVQTSVLHYNKSKLNSALEAALILSAKKPMEK
jgi:hypothetical protein